MITRVIIHNNDTIVKWTWCITLIGNFWSADHLFNIYLLTVLPFNKVQLFGMIVPIPNLKISSMTRMELNNSNKLFKQLYYVLHKFFEHVIVGIKKNPYDDNRQIQYCNSSISIIIIISLARYLMLWNHDTFTGQMTHVTLLQWILIFLLVLSCKIMTYWINCTMVQLTFIFGVVLSCRIMTPLLDKWHNGTIDFCSVLFLCCKIMTTSLDKWHLLQ